MDIQVCELSARLADRKISIELTDGARDLLGELSLVERGAYTLLLGISAVPLVVTAVILTLFIPCIAQFMVMLKERGVKTALAITLFIFPFAFFVGFVLNLTLTTLGVSF